MIEDHPFAIGAAGRAGWGEKRELAQADGNSPAQFSPNPSGVPGKVTPRKTSEVDGLDLTVVYLSDFCAALAEREYLDFLEGKNRC